MAGHHHHPTGWHGEGLRIQIKHERGETDKHMLKHGGFHFQCPPLEVLQIQYGFNHTNYETIKAGEFSRKAGKKLTIVTFATLFVEWGEYVVRDGHWDPMQQVDRVKQIASSGTPFRLLIGEFLPKKPEVNMMATLRDFQVELRAGEPDARYVNVEFHQYRSTDVKRKRRGHGKGKHKGKDKPPCVHKLEANDTLAKLARHYYHQPSLALYIGMVNRGLQFWGRNTPIVQARKWKIGDKIDIPKEPGFPDKKTRMATKVERDDLLDSRDELADELFPGDDD